MESLFPGKARVLPLICLTAALAFLPASGLPASGADRTAPAVKTVSPFVYCSISHKGPYSGIPQVIPGLIAAMKAQNLFPLVRGPMIGVFHGSLTAAAPGEPNWEIGFIIDGQASLRPPLDKKAWEFRTVIAAFHTGSYESIDRTIGEMTAWMEAAGYEQAGPVLERYADAGDDTSRSRTEIWIPCRKKNRP